MFIRLIVFLCFSLPLIATADFEPSWYYLPSRVAAEAPSNCRPRLSKKLHVGQFFISTQSSMQATQTKLFHNLLQVLYGAQPIFHRNAANPLNKSGLENLFAQVKEIAVRRLPGYHMRCVADLANIDLGNPQQQFIYAQLLQGSGGEFFRGEWCSLPSLESYISLKKRGSCLDVYTAPRSILLALFGKDAVVNDAISYREQVDRNFRLDAEAIEKEFRSKFVQHILPGINPCLVSFRVPPANLMEKGPGFSSNISPVLGGLRRDYWNEDSYRCCAVHFDDAIDEPDGEADEAESISQDLSISQSLLANIPARGLPCADCGSPSIYNGYLDRDSRKHISHLERELQYAQSHHECTCYWPECSEEAAKISDEAYDLYKNLVTSSPLSDVLSKPEEQKKFLEVDKGDLNAHGVAVALIAQQFRFSDFYELHEELCKYALEQFGKRQIGKYFKVKYELNEILGSLYTKFFDLYTHCLAKHPNSEIEQELCFMKLLVGDASALNTTAASPMVSREKQPNRTKYVLKNKHGHSKVAKKRLVKKWVGAFSFQASVLVEKGTLLNDILQYEESIKILSDAIRLDPSNRDGYIERAYAYLETNQIPLALDDYKKIKTIGIAPPFLCPAQKGILRAVPKGFVFWYTEEEQEFLSGVIEGILIEVDDSIGNIPSAFIDTCTGIGYGVWAFATRPDEVTREFTLAAYALGKYCCQHYDDDWIQYSVGSLRDFADSWPDLGSRDRGREFGKAIGKYGVDIFSTVVTSKSFKYFRDLKRANTVLTLERLAASKSNEVKILEKTAKVAAARKKLLEAAKSGKIIGRSINQRHHIMQSHHAWERLVKLSGDEEKDFKAVVKVLEENKVFSKEYLIEEELRRDTVVRVYKKQIGNETVRLEFSKDSLSGAFLLNNGWVETR